MSGHYSYVVWCDAEEAPMPEYDLFLEYGTNAFIMTVTDEDQFHLALETANSRIINRYNLENPIDWEPVSERLLQSISGLEED